MGDRIQSLVGPGLESNDYEGIVSLLKAGEEVAQAGPMAPLFSSIHAQLGQMEELNKQFNEVKKSVKVLEEHPEDPEANLAMGRFTCFCKKDWTAGLVFLSRGSDPVLKKLAQQDQANPDNKEAAVELGDCWNEQAEFFFS